MLSPDASGKPTAGKRVRADAKRRPQEARFAWMRKPFGGEDLKRAAGMAPKKTTDCR